MLADLETSAPPSSIPIRHQADLIRPDAF